MILITEPLKAGWETQWIDTFNGTGVNWNNWTAQTAANYNAEVQCYTDDESSADKNFDVSNGTLKIIARRQAISCPGLGGRQKSWTSGRINSKDKSEFLYGRIEARIKFNDLRGGTWPAFWMLENRIFEQPIANDNDFVNWPNPGAGEIDVWEWFSNDPNRYITNFFNTSVCGSEYRYSYPGGASDVQQWHKYAIEWNPDSITFYVDDTLVRAHNITNCAQYKEPMFVLLNVAIGGTLGGNIDATLDTATMEVDYIAHCSATNSNNATYCDESTPSGVATIPEITSTAATNINTGQQYSYSMIVNDTDGDDLTLSAPVLPSWLTFDTDTGVLSGTATTNDIGVHPVTLSVTDGTNITQQLFSITVSAAPNNAPVITSTDIVFSATVAEGYSYTFTAEDSDGDSLTLFAREIPTWLAFDTTTGVLSGTPTNNDVGSHSVILVVSDGIDETSQVFDVTVKSAVIVVIVEETEDSGGGSIGILFLLLLSTLIVYKNNSKHILK